MLCSVPPTELVVVIMMWQDVLGSSTSLNGTQVPLASDTTIRSYYRNRGVGYICLNHRPNSGVAIILYSYLTLAFLSVDPLTVSITASGTNTAARGDLQP